MNTDAGPAARHFAISFAVTVDEGQGAGDLRQRLGPPPRRVSTLQSYPKIASNAPCSYDTSTF